MTIGSILLATALLVAVGIFVFRPFFESPTTSTTKLLSSQNSERENLLTQKEVLLSTIKDLEFDYDTGKVPASIYERQRAYLVEKAADMLKHLDELPADTESAIESAIAKRRQKQPVPPPSVDIDQFIEEAIAQKRHKPTQSPPPAVEQPSADSPPRFCTQCGKPADNNDKFCAYCGTPLK